MILLLSMIIIPAAAFAQEFPETSQEAAVTETDESPAGADSVNADERPENAVFVIGRGEYFVNGEIPGVKMDATPYVERGQAFVPARALGSALGAGVEWDGGQNKASFTLLANTVEMVIGKKEVTVDGQTQAIDAAPRLKPPGKVFVPVKYVVKELGYQIGYEKVGGVEYIYCWPKDKPKPTEDIAKVKEATAKLEPIPVSVIMYHQVGDGPNSLWLEEKKLEEQVRWLSENDYRAITLSEAYEYINGRVTSPGGKVVALTFDDGYSSFYTKVAPLLQRYEYVATVCVITDQVGRGDHVTWGQLKELAAAGFEVASHTKSHPDLTRLGKARLTEEVAGSKKILEERLGVPVQFFCYPSGIYNGTVARAVRDAGYIGAVTTKPGIVSPGADPYLMPRVRIYRGMGLEAFAAGVSAK